LFVCARNSSFTYKGRAVKARQIATELGVQYVLEGSVRKAGNRVRINAQLIDAVEDRHLWAERYDRELEDIFAVQDEITQNITGALGVKLIDTAQERALRKRPENLDAWDCVLRSWAHLMRFTREGNAESRAMAQRAVELDSDYSHGHVVLAWADFMDGVFGWSENPPEAFQRAFQSARKAVEFDQTLYAAHMILGVVLAFSGQLDRALEALERSLELNPNNADTHTHKAMGLIAAGRVDEGLAAIETAMRLNPHYPGWYFMPVAHAHFVRRQYREAIAPLTRLLDGNPEFVAAQALRAACHAQLDEAEAARADVDELLRLNPDHSVALVARANNFQDEEVKTRLLDALRKAGLPE
jgi:adenylate cyclase